ncbi:MAG: NERD domain-containing protein [Firmicutes bacterium]|nr:NERD domain-containing protein [Bacillota bacterium]
MAKGLLDILLDKIFDEKFTGWYGEKLTEKELKFANLLGKKGKILKNVYLPKDNGETSEVDVIYITQKGISHIGSVVCDNSLKIQKVPKNKFKKIRKLVNKI